MTRHTGRLLLAIMVVGLACASCLTAKPADSVTLSVLYNNRASTPFREDWRILQEYQERHNVILDVRLGDDAAYDTALAQTFASGDLPDLILKVWPEQIETQANAGLLLPVSDYVEQMPHFQAYIDSHGLQAEVDKLRLENGKYYVLPGYQREIQVQQWIYRRDLFEKHGLGVPATYDELYDDLVVLKEAYPDSTPLTACWGGAHLLSMMGSGFGVSAGWNGVRFYDESSRVWKYAPATDAYRELYSFLNRCYEADVLDPETLTQDDATYYDKLQAGRGFVSVSWVSSGFANWNKALAENGVSGGEWAPMPVPESPVGVRALPPVDPFRKGLAIASRVATEPYLDELLAFVDWACYSEEGQTLTHWGVEGLTFERGDEGIAYLTTVHTPINPDGTTDIGAEYGFGLFFDLCENEALVDYLRPAEIVDFLNESLAGGETAPTDPALNLTADEIEAVRIVSEKLDPYVAEMSTAFITGQSDIESEWDTYVATLQERGYQTLESVWQGASSRE